MGAMKGPWKWTLLALLLVSTPILKADQTQSECTSDEECLLRNLERAKRSSDLQVEVNGDQTTTYYLKTDSVGRPRPLGLITSTEGAFVNDGTTTQYTTQILGMSLHGTYAKIISTSQRVFSTIPVKTDVPEYHPTGLVSSVVDTKVNEGTTTLQTTEVYRTFVGNLYAQEVVTRSEVIKPTSVVAESEIQATATVQSSIVTEIPSEQSTSGSVVFQKSYLTQIVGQRVIPSVSVQREDDWATEDSNKLLDSFTEDNLLRARKADLEGAVIVDNIEPSKPTIALPTFRAGRRLDEIFADEDAQKSTTSSTTTTTTTEKQPEIVVRTEQRIESHEVKGDSVVVKIVHQDVPVVPSPTPAPTAVEEDPTKPTTVTYEGFAAFTTQVGNTHIVFKPSLGLNPITALPRPSLESSTVVVPSSEPIVSSRVTMESIVSVEVSTEAPVVVVTSDVSSSESVVVKEEKEQILTPEPAVLQEPELPLKMNALMSNKPLEVMATALEESQEPARKARISVGDNPWVVFATNSPVEAEAPTARQIGADSSTLVADVETASESVKESVAEASTRIVAPETSTPTPIIAMATEQVETPVVPSPMKSQSVSVFSAVTEEKIAAPEVAVKEEAAVTMGSEEPETETEASTEPNVMPAVIMPSMVEPEEMTMSGTAFTTYTYFTTFFDDRTTKVITREEVVTNVLKTGSPDADAFAPDSGHQARGIFSSVDSGMMKTFFTTYTYFTTLSVGDQTVVSSRTEVYSNVVMAAGEDTDDSVMAEFGLVPESESASNESSSSSTIAITNVVPSSVRQLETSVWAGKVMEPHTESDESMNHPVAQAAPAMLDAPSSASLESSMTQAEPTAKTLFTTFTYFTTFFNEGTSTVTSKEETVTNVVTEGGETSALTATEAIFPVTYYTTYTYWTTSTSEGQVVVTSREETQSRVVIPTETEASGTGVSETTEEPVVPSTMVPTLTTFYTTFTYFTTSFDGETPVVSSSFETVTNVIDGLSSAAEQSSARAVGEGATSNAVHEPMGLLSSLTTVEVNNGITTTFSTDVIGTFINGLYATILESTSSVIAAEMSPTLTLPQTTSRFPVGLVSVNMGTAYDIDDPTTTYFTSKAFGTYIGDLYAQVIESTTSLSIDEAKTVPATADEFRTGLVRSIEGSIVKDSVTTVYASQIVGTVIDGLYAQIIQSTSTFIEATPVAVVVETNTVAAPTSEAPVSDNSVLPHPATTPLTLEGSISNEVTTPSAEENDATPTAESKLLGGKLKFPSRPSPVSRSRPAFSPSFRPVNTQRPRPGLPIKKAKPSSSSSSIEPSPVSTSSFSATRATSSRFSSSSLRSSATAIPSSNRLFRLTRPSSSGFAASSSSSFGSTLSPRRSSSSVNPTAAGSSSFRRFSSSSEGAGSSRLRPSSAVSVASSRASAGVGSLTRLHQRVSSSAVPKIQPTPVVEEKITSIEIPVEEDNPEDLQDISEEPQEVTVPTRQPGRLPLRPVTPRPAPSTTTNSRRQFPFRRPQLPTTSAPASTPDSDNGITGGPTTAKPRFVRPPKITVTARPRPTLSPLNRRLVKRPGQFDGEEDIDTQASSVSLLRRRTKREDPFYTRQQRTPIRRRQVFEQSRRPSSTRSSRTRAATWEDPAAFDYLDYDASEEAPATSKPRFSSSSRQTASSFRSRAPATTQAPVRSRPSRPRLTPTGARQSEFTLTNRQPTTSQRFRKPETTSTRSSFRRPETTTSSRTRTRVSSQSVTTEEPRASTGRRFNSNSRRPSSSSTRIRDNEFEEVPPTRQREPVDAAPALITPLTVTHRVPSETTIPVVKNGATEFRTVITAMPSLQVLPTYSSTKIAGSWRYLASELSSIKAPGMTEVTQYFIKPSDTSVVEFTPTTIRGRHTSFSHVIPSTVYEVETSVTTIQDPVAATNNLLQQLLLGNLGANPLLGVPGAPATPVTQFTTHTSTYVTTLTDALSTILPITLRGKEVRTTIVHSTTSVVTLTEMSTETNIITPAVQQLPFVSQANPLASLLPVLLQNQLLQGQLGLQPTPALQAQPIQPTVAPQIHEEEKDFHVTESPRKSTRQQQNFHPEEEEDHHDEIIQPAKPQPVTSVVTLYLSGRRPGEFSSVLSTVTLDGSEASVVKRHSPQSAAPIEASALPFAIGTDRGLFELPDGYKEEDLEYYLVSAMNEIGAEEIYDTAEAQHLQYVLTHAQPTPELNGDYGKKLQVKSRKARQALDSAEDDSELLSSLVEDDWAKIVPASQSQPEVEEVQKQPEPVAPSKVRKTKTVIVTRKIRPTAGAPEVTPSEALLEELGITNTRRRKVVVVTRRVKSSKSAVDPLIEPTFAFQEVSGNDLTSSVVQEPAFSEPVVDPTPVTPASREGRRLVTVTRKRPMSASDLPEPQLPASTTPQQASATTPKSAPQLDGSLGDVYAPRTYYTIYSYLYTVLNTGVDKPVSSRMVTVSEIVRGKDGRLPSTFTRTENNNGLYTIAAGNGFSDLGTRVSLGETLHVNLASAILVKYGRGAIRAHQSAELKPLDSTSATQKRPRVRPTPVEPSFTSPVEENNVDSSSVATQSLPTRSRTTITRTIARTQARSTAATTAKQSEPASTATTRVASPQRQRGTVRFGGSSGSVFRSAAVPQVATTTSRTFIRRPTLTSSRSTISPVSRFTHPSRVVANSVEDDYQEQEFDHDYQDNPEHFDDYHEYDEDLTHGEDREHSVEDIPQYDEEYPEHEDDYPVDEEHFNESEEPIQDDASFETSLAPSSTATVTPATSSFTVSSTRSRVNPLEKHLSSIRAAARFSSGVSSSSLLPFRSRLAQRLSASSSISGSVEPSHVYYHKFATTSTLLVDGGRDPVLVTLMTSTLTTLGDSQLSVVTESPQAFMPVTSTSSSPLLRSSSRLSLFSTRVASSRNSPSSSATSTVVPTLSTLTTVLAPSTEAVEASFVTTEASVEESTEPITTPMPESVETTPFSVEGEEEMKQEPEAVVPAIANPTTTTVFSTVLETELRTFTAVVTRKSNDEEIVTTHFETVPEVVTKTVTVVQTLDAPTARFVGNAGASAQIIDPSPKAGLRGGRLSIDANARLPLATKVMSNGVEVIVAGERKNTLLAHEVVQGTQVLEASSPFTLPPTAISNAMLVDSEDTVVSSEVVTETIFSEVEATPTLPLPGVSAQPELEASLPLLPLAEDSDGPIFATKTYFTTSTYYTTMLEDESTVIKSRTEVTSSVATERLPQGLGALLMSTAPVFVLPSDTRTTYLSLGDNVYGQLRTILATATYYITDAQGSVATKQLVIPQVSTSTITTSVLPSDAVIQPSSSILSSASLASIKASFLASSAAPASILSADQLQSIKSSFVLSSTPTVGPEEADVADTTTAQLSTEDGNTLPEEPNLGGALVGATPQLNLPFPPPQVGTAVVTSPTTVTGLDGSVSSVTSGATVVMVTDAAGGVAVLPTEVLTSGTTVVGTIVNQKPSLWNLGTLGTVGLAALSQGLAGNSLGGLNINLGPVIDSMTGLISNAFLTRRNDSIARTQSRVPAETPVQQQDPIFIPVGSIGASQNDREDVVARQPTFIPLRRPEPPTARPPAPAVPLQPKNGSPLFKPGTDPRPLVHFPGQPADSPRPGSFRSPGIETGFSAIQPTTRATVITGAETVFLGRPNLSLQRPNVVNFENHQGPVNPSRPIIFQGATTQFFDPNGQPFPDRNPVRFPAPIAPPNQPVLGNLVPGPDGKPVRIVAVPEGVNPPPGASGQVFVRPAAPAVQPALEPVPAVRPAQQTPALPAVRPGSAPIRPLPMVEFDLPRPVSPSVQTIVSIEGDNKIVGTRIVSQGQTVLIQPTQPAPRPVEPLPTAAVIPSSVAVAVPSVVTEEPKVPMVVDSIEVSTEPVEQPSPEASVPEVSLPEVPAVPEASPVPEVPVEEEVAVSVASEQPEAPSSVQLLPSFAPEVITTSSHVFPDIASWTTPTPVATSINEPDGITKVILGANNQLTTFVTRVETSATHAHTLLSTIVDGHTQVNAVQPTVVADQSTEGAHKAPNTQGPAMAETVSIAQSTQEAVQTPSMEEKSTTATTTTTTTQPPIRLGGIFGLGSNEAGTTTTTTEESIADKVLDESINNVLLSGPQRTQVSVNHKPVEVAKCKPQCKDFEICQSRGSASPTCVCRPGYARSDATQPCTKAFTYQVRLALENAKQPSRSNFTWMADPSAPEYHQMTQVLRTGIQNTLGRADLWDAYRNADVMAVKPMEGSVDNHALAEFVVQLGSQYDEQQLKSSLQKALENNQYRLGEDVMVAARVSDGLVVQDFDECTGGTHDCPESSVCVNNHGSYECRCKPGMQDAIDGSGRLCVSASQELGDCELCNRQGRCDTTPAGEIVCVCNYWFAGDKCQFNLKVLMIALVSLGVLLILLTFGCIIVCCIRNRRASSTISPAAPAFLRYRGGMMPPTGTMDRTAMIRGDTSSESSVGLGVSGIDNMAGTLEGRGKGNGGASLQSYRHYGEGEDKVPVIIPRVRTHRDQPPVQNEQQMLSYLEQGRTGQGRLRASTDNLVSVGARSNSTFTTLRGPERTINEARSYDETTVRPAVRHLHSSTSSVNRTQSHGGKQYFQHEDSEGSNFDSL